MPGLIATLNPAFMDLMQLNAIVAVLRPLVQSVGSATYDIPSLADGAGATTTVACPGAQLGDFAFASFSLDTQGITITAWVSAANVVSVRFQNESGGPLDIGSGTLRVFTESSVINLTA